MLHKKIILQLVIATLFLLSGCASPNAGIPSPLVANDILPAQIKTGGAEAIAPAPPAAAPVDPTSREDMMNPIVLTDALTNIDALEKTFDWKPFRPGVEIARIYNSPDNGPSAAFLRYQPGASVPLHMHGGYEHIFILKGTQLDRSGEHGAGTVIINPPGSSHIVTSPKGCIVLIVWDKPVILAK